MRFAFTFFIIAALAAAGALAQIQVSDPAFNPIVADITAILAANQAKRATYIRLAWHASGTFDSRRNGSAEYRYGSFGGTLRFASELAHADNAGLQASAAELETIHAKYPWISYGDLYTLAGSLGITTGQGPSISWTHGRCDAPDDSYSPVNGNLPEALQTGDVPPHWNATLLAIQGVFERLGFSAQETVALIGAHCMGGARVANSGFDGPWTATPNQFTNRFFVDLATKAWTLGVAPIGGATKQQYNVAGPGNTRFMMLPSDFGMQFWAPYISSFDTYRQSQETFFADFKAAWEKLITLGKDDAFAKTTFAAGCTVIPGTTTGTTGTTSTTGTAGSPGSTGAAAATTTGIASTTGVNIPSSPVDESVAPRVEAVLVFAFSMIAALLF